ncbi:MAG: sugar-transfer associated ATP-grasp domain-containing protein [Ferruginibacter sp.]
MSIKSFLRRKYSLGLRLSKVIKKEFEMKIHLPFSTRLNMWINGFWSVSYYRYDFKKYGMKAYISDYQDNMRWSMLDSIDNTGLDIYLDNKLLFQKCIDSIAKTPKHYCLIIERQVIPMEMNFAGTIEEIISVIRHRDMMLKPLDGMWGYGIYLFTYKDGNFHIDGKETSEALLKEFILSKSNCALCDRVQQSSITGDFYNNTLNTIRVLSLIDPENGKPFIAGAVQRVGTANSFPVDNFHRGGIAADIDLATGEYSYAASIFPVKEGLTWFDKHPETNVVIKGFINKKWPEIERVILTLAKKFSFHRIIAWDVAIDENDDVVIIEGNTGADPKIHQIHKPLLLDERVRSFCEYHRIIKK